jgi:hypothetical protein
VNPPVTSADVQTFRQLTAELALVVDRIAREATTRRLALAWEIRARIQAADGELIDLDIPMDILPPR